MHKGNKEAGFTLIGVLLIFTILSVLGISLVMLSFTSVKTSTAERDNQAVFYVAEAGLNDMVKRVEDEVRDIYEEVDNLNLDHLEHEEAENKRKNMFFADVGNIEKPISEFEIEDAIIDTDMKVKNEDDIIEITINSKGELGGEARKVEKVLTITWKNRPQARGELPPFTVFTNEQFTMTNGTVEGDIGTIDESDGAIYFPGGGPSHKKGDIYVPDGKLSIVNNKAPWAIKSEIKPLNKSYSIPNLPGLPDFPGEVNHNPYNVHLKGDMNKTIALSGDRKFGDILLENSRELTFDVGNAKRNISVTNLKVQQGHIRIKGNGSLNIFVENELQFNDGNDKGDSTLNKNGNPNNLNIFYEGNNEIRLAGAQRIYGSIFAEHADVLLHRGGNIIGNIFTGGENFKIDGGSTNQAQLFFAPNAHFDMSTGGSNFTGLIIADTFTIGGGWKIKRPTSDSDFLCGEISPLTLGMKCGEDEEEPSNPGGGLENDAEDPKEPNSLQYKESPIIEIEVPTEE